MAKKITSVQVAFRCSVIAFSVVSVLKTYKLPYGCALFKT